VGKKGKNQKDGYNLTKRATPDMFCNFNLDLSLYKTVNDKVPANQWLHLNFNQLNISRQMSFMITKENILKINMNCITNRFHHLNGRIPLTRLNKSFNCYKIKYKKLFLNISKLNFNHAKYTAKQQRSFSLSKLKVVLRQASSTSKYEFRSLSNLHTEELFLSTTLIV
jgi:hypothetical protein